MGAKSSSGRYIEQPLRLAWQLALIQHASRWAIHICIFSAGLLGWQPLAVDSYK